MASENGQLSDAELAELAAFADGSLPRSDRERVAARVERSVELRALVDEQRRAIAAIELLDAPAPTRLFARVEAERGPASSRARWPRVALVGGLAATLAATVLVVVLLSGSEAGAPTIGEAAELSQRGATAPAPPADSAEPNLLAASIGGVAFPDYAESFGWRASGERTDDLGERMAGTVYYGRAGSEIAYTIVSGEALEWPAGARLTTLEGIELRSFERDGETVVTWLRDGRVCVLSGAGVARDELLELAAWKGEGAVAF